MSSPAKAHEPTMEEILASIRRIISDDDKVTPRAPAPKPASDVEEAPPMKPAAEPVGQDDIDALFASVDKAEEVGQDDIDAMFAASEPAPSPAAAATAAQSQALELEDDLEILDLTEEMRSPEPVRESQPQPKPAVAPPRAEPAFAKPSASRDETLISAAVSDQVASAFGSLAHTVLAGNAKTLDDIVREMLRPMLKAWLDDNLPPMVERLVRAEIERVARGGR